MTKTTPQGAGPSSPWAVLLDVDGTLVDTNYLHVHAWWQAFRAAGHEVSAYDIHRAIGMPSDDLVRALVGTEDQRVVDGHEERWEPLRPQARAFHRAGELVRACAEAGARVVWATSGNAEDIEAFLDLVGCREHLHAVVGGDDVERGKPDPEVVRVALERADVPPDRAVLVGDTVHDMRAARAAGVGAIGLLCGGIGQVELAEAGAAAVVGNPSELLDDLDRCLAMIAGR